MTLQEQSDIGVDTRTNSAARSIAAGPSSYGRESGHVVCVGGRMVGKATGKRRQRHVEIRPSDTGGINRASAPAGLGMAVNTGKADSARRGDVKTSSVQVGALQGLASARAGSSRSTQAMVGRP